MCRSSDASDIGTVEFETSRSSGDERLKEQILAWWTLIAPFIDAYGSVAVDFYGERPVSIRNDERAHLLGAFTFFLGSGNTHWAVGLEVLDEDGAPCRWAVASLSPRIDPSYTGDPLAGSPITAYDVGVEITTLGAGTADVLKVEGGHPAFQRRLTTHRGRRSNLSQARPQRRFLQAL